MINVIMIYQYAFILGGLDMLEPLFLDAVFQEKIWGGTKLKDLFGYNLKK